MKYIIYVSSTCMVTSIWHIVIFEWNIVTYCYICITLEFYLSFGWKLCLVPVWPGTESADLDDREMRRVCHKWEQAIRVMLHLMSVDLQNKIIMQAIVVLNSITLRLQNSCYITPMELLYSRLKQLHTPIADNQLF